MRKRISLVVALFHEAGKCLANMPFLLIQPLWTFIILAAFLVYWVIVLAYISTTGQFYISWILNIHVDHHQVTQRPIMRRALWASSTFWRAWPATSGGSIWSDWFGSLSSFSLVSSLSSLELQLTGSSPGEPELKNLVEVICICSQQQGRPDMSDWQIHLSPDSPPHWIGRVRFSDYSNREDPAVYPHVHPS